MRVSVCMAVYNGEKYLHEQCTSILKQIGTADELVISDDHSRDQSEAIIKALNDPRVILVQNELGQGRINNFQNAINHASGEVIYLSDQDDVWLDTKYEEMTALCKEYDLVISDAIVVDDTLQKIAPSLFDQLHSQKGIIKNIIRSTYYGSCMAVSRKLIDRAMPFPRNNEMGHDLWLGLVAEMTKAPVCFYKKPLILYRRHNGAFTATGMGGSERSIFRKLYGRLVMVILCLKFYLNYKLWKKV